MKDPWRIVDPLRAAPPRGKPAGRVHLEDIDLEADMRPTRACVLRFRSCSLEVATKELTSERDALTCVARCVIALKKASLLGQRTHRLLSGVYARVEGDGDDPPAGVAAAVVSCGGVVIAFAGVTLEHGVMALARALIAARQDPVLGPIVTRYGVTPMLRTT